jgi:transcriptional regulator with XRE-family HTH domain
MSRGRTPNEFSSKLGERIRAIREKKGWTQADMAAHLGLERGHISEIEHGRRAITLPTLQTVATGLDTTMSKLLKGL